MARPEGYESLFGSLPACVRACLPEDGSMGVWEHLVPKELFRLYQGGTWWMQRSVTGSWHMVIGATKGIKILGWAIVWHEPWWHVRTYEWASIMAREPVEQDSMGVVQSWLIGAIMHTHKCKSLLVMLRQMEGWPWHIDVLVLHSHISLQSYWTVTIGIRAKLRRIGWTWAHLKGDTRMQRLCSALCVSWFHGSFGIKGNGQC